MRRKQIERGIIVSLAPRFLPCGNMMFISLISLEAKQFVPRPQTLLTVFLLFVCVRYLSGSCLSGPSATQPAATCKASTTWSRRSSSSTSSSTSVSVACPSCPLCPPFTVTFSCLMFCVICSRGENQPSLVLKVLLSTVHSGTFAAGEIRLLTGSSPQVTWNQPLFPWDSLSFHIFLASELLLQLYSMPSVPLCIFPSACSLFFFLLNPHFSLSLCFNVI